MQNYLPTFVMHHRLLFPEWQDKKVNMLQGNEAGAVIASNIATPRKFLREIFFATGLQLIQSTKQARKDVCNFSTVCTLSLFLLNALR